MSDQIEYETEQTEAPKQSNHIEALSSLYAEREKLRTQLVSQRASLETMQSKINKTIDGLRAAEDLIKESVTRLAAEAGIALQLPSPEKLIDRNFSPEGMRLSVSETLAFPNAPRIPPALEMTATRLQANTDGPWTAMLKKIIR